MAKLEQIARKRLRKHQLQQLILGTVAAVGMITLVAVAPNVIGALGKLGVIKPNKRQKEIVNRARDRMIENGLLARDRSGFLSLTQRGELVLWQLENNGLQKKRPRRWDGKWRILIFDIPERRKMVREKIRYTLSSVGFVRLQDSVWIYPHDCEDMVALLKADLKIGRDLLYLIVEEMEGDRRLREYFKLPKLE